MKGRLCTWGSVTALMGVFCVAPCFAQTLTWLGTLDYRFSIATDVSDDGSVVVGIAYTPNFDFRAFYWRNGRMEPIAPPRWLGWSQAYGVSGDGNVVVGDMMDQVGYMVAFQWAPSAGIEFLGAFGGVGGRANAASYDGSTIVGWAEARNEDRLAFRWRQGQGMQALGAPATSVATGVSADGSAVIGYVNQGGTVRAFYWTEATGAQMMTGFGGANIAANDISPDGRVIVGYADYPGQTHHACRWLAPNQPPQDIHTFSDSDSSQSTATAVNRGGTIIMGQYWPSSGVFSRPFRWTPQRGMEDLNTVYAGLLTDGSVLFNVAAMSPDGRFIVGSGVNARTGRREAFLLDTRVPCRAHSGDVDENGCVDDADLLAVLFAFGQTGQDLGRVDVNCDETVDDADLLTVLFAFGQGC
jgi:probable HAF family extracellular repeat protein